MIIKVSSLTARLCCVQGWGGAGAGQGVGRHTFTPSSLHSVTGRWRVRGRLTILHRFRGTNWQFALPVQSFTFSSLHSASSSTTVRSTCLVWQTLCCSSVHSCAAAVQFAGEGGRGGGQTVTSTCSTCSCAPAPAPPPPASPPDGR